MFNNPKFPVLFEMLGAFGTILIIKEPQINTVILLNSSSSFLRTGNWTTSNIHGHF